MGTRILYLSRHSSLSEGRDVADFVLHNSEDNVMQDVKTHKSGENNILFINYYSSLLNSINIKIHR